MYRSSEIIIRAHHVRFFYIAQSTGDASAAASQADLYKRRLRDRVKDNIPSEDYIGEGGIFADQFESRLTKAFAQVRNARPETPILITHNRLDNFCAACAVGKHCHTKKVDSIDKRELIRLAQVFSEHRIPFSYKEEALLLKAVDFRRALQFIW